MPKFYVYDGLEKTIINADSPLQACFRAIKHIFKDVPVNGFYKVSEQGFEDHDDDVIFSSEEVIQALLDIMRHDNEKGYTSKQKKLRRRRKNRKKDEDGD
tara:strand:- start:2788 stop:3087 length:300 start_codon:yes stop_codon:yes gene_type:complete